MDSKQAMRRAIVPRLTGATAFIATARREGQDITVTVEGEAKNWRVLLVGIPNVHGVTGGTARQHKDGVEVVAEPGVAALIITLEDVAA